MIVHDEHCNEFHIDHTPGHESNPAIWSVPTGEVWTVPANHPVTGWRFAMIHHIGNIVVEADGYDATNETPWEHTLAAPHATCNRARWGAITVQDIISRASGHTTVPTAHCECGYRIVRTLGELTRYLRWAKGKFAPYPTSVLPAPIREQVEHLGSTVTPSLTLVSVQGCGDTAGAQMRTYYDPEGTLRVEWLATAGQFIVNTGDPVADALHAWGARTVSVPEVTEVHEPDECHMRHESFQLWKLLPTTPPSLDDTELRHGDSGASGDGWTSTGRWGNHGAAGIAITDEGRTLLVRSGGRWQLPGGARNEGETPGECVVREALEEVQADITHVNVTGAFAHVDAAGWAYTTITAAGHVEASPGAEVSDVGWFRFPPDGCHPDLEAVWEKLVPATGRP